MINVLGLLLLPLLIISCAPVQITNAVIKKEAFIQAQGETGRNIVIGKSNPLPELLPKISTNQQGDTIREFSLTVEDVMFQIFPGRHIMGWGFNGSVPGPTIRVNKGDTVRIHLTNNTTDEHTLHVHGQKKPLNMDGIPYLSQEPIQKGETFTYEFVANNNGTHWYHCHVDTVHHIDMGMYGAFIVEDKSVDIPTDREYVLLLDEWATSSDHNHHQSPTNTPAETTKETGEGIPTHQQVHQQESDAQQEKMNRGWYPKTYSPYNVDYDGFSINGKSFPYTEPLDVEEGDLVRIRFINAGYKNHFMHLHSHKFKVIARDGSPVDEPQMIDTVQVGPGQRVDILLKADNPGLWPFHCHRTNHVANDNIYPGGMLTFIRYIDLDELFD